MFRFDNILLFYDLSKVTINILYALFLIVTFISEIIYFLRLQDQRNIILVTVRVLFKLILFFYLEGFVKLFSFVVICVCGIAFLL